MICICGFHSAFCGYNHLASLYSLKGTNNDKDVFLKVKEMTASLVLVWEKLTSVTPKYVWLQDQCNRTNL
jgi:hypothetical protein